MKGHYNQANALSSTNNTNFVVGFYSSIILALVTIAALGLALTAVPVSGTNAPGEGIPYPYLDTLKQYPKDYFWMFAAVLMILFYLIYMILLNSIADQRRKIFGQISVTFAIIASIILLADYYIQISVVPVSLMNNETEGLALVTQYNPHGIFIALEELGYIMMSCSFLFISLIFYQKNPLELFIKWIFTISFTLTIISLLMISIQYGVERKDRFEVAAVSISWLALIVNGILVSIYLKNKMKTLSKTDNESASDILPI